VAIVAVFLLQRDRAKSGMDRQEISMAIGSAVLLASALSAGIALMLLC
jgi:hypothetical protein